MTSRAPLHIPYLDGWRGLAIVFVLIGHFSRTPVFGWLGWFGVALFFALSGRLMGELLFVKQVRLDDFFVRRATRVLPTFWLFIATMALATLALPGWHASGEQVLTTLAFLSTYFPPEASAQHHAWPVGHIWSLNVEEHTYVWLAGCAVLARVLRVPVQWLLFATLALSLACMLHYMGLADAPERWQWRTEVAAMAIVASAALRCLPLVRSRALAPLPLLACALAAVCYASYLHKGVHLWLASLCLAFAVNYIHVTPARLLQALATPWLRWFGRCSFSLYLWQQPFFAAVNAGALHPVLGLLGGLSVGALSFYLFEDPVRRYLNRKWTQRSACPLPAEAGDEERATG